MIRDIKLDLDFDIFLTADYSVHCGSCIKHQVYELTDIHEQYGGFPNTYIFDNTKIHQLWWTNEQIDYQEIGRQLGMEIITMSSILQPPGCVIPLHRDTFFQINKRYPDRTDLKVRANIYLEDYKVGHFIQYETDHGYKTSVDWQAGDGFLWDSDVLHLGANAGMENKYTLQISGFLLDTK
jgi:hypothetical protein